MICIIDTETTGFLTRGLPTDPDQPYMASFCALLCGNKDVPELQAEDQRRIQSTIYTYIKPDGRYDEMPSGAFAVNGITAQHAQEFGISGLTAIRMAADILRSSRLVVAHNWEGYDRQILEIHARRYLSETDMDIDPFKKGAVKFVDTMLVAKSKNLPGNLGKLYKEMFGRDFPNAHTALGDTKATAAVFWRMVQKGMITL